MDIQQFLVSGDKRQTKIPKKSSAPNTRTVASRPIILSLQGDVIEKHMKMPVDVLQNPDFAFYCASSVAFLSLLWLLAIFSENMRTSGTKVRKVKRKLVVT